MKVYLYVNGILNFPGSSRNWTGRAVTYTHLYSPAKAEKIEYLSFATFSRLLGQRNRVRKLARTLSFYYLCDTPEIHLVGHSNGCAVILEALRYLDWPKVEHVHFFSPACDADCRRSGLFRAQQEGRIRRLFVYIAGRDTPLRLASSRLGRFFGYGTMGLEGPIHADPSRTSVLRRPEWGHSDWWSDSNFWWTMKCILKPNETFPDA